jgi:predicted RNase H-like HicB family nuclease
MNPKYTMMIQWSEEDQLYLVHLPEFPWQQFVTHGSTYSLPSQAIDIGAKANMCSKVLDICS